MGLGKQDLYSKDTNDKVTTLHDKTFGSLYFVDILSQDLNVGSYQGTSWVVSASAIESYADLTADDFWISLNSIQAVTGGAANSIFTYTLTYNNSNGDLTISMTQGTGVGTQVHVDVYCKHQ